MRFLGIFNFVHRKSFSRSRSFAGPRKRASRDMSAATPLVSHSHTVSTRHPSFFKALLFFASRTWLRLNFSAQKSLRLFGMLATAQPSWPCQKHPCTKTTFRREGKTKSGHP